MSMQEEVLEQLAADIVELLRASDLFVFPSISEGLPVALMEAMACGVPCIARNIRGSRDIIAKRQKCKLFNARRELTVLLQTLTNSLNQREEFGFCFNKKFIEKYSLQHMNCLMM